MACRSGVCPLSLHEHHPHRSTSVSAAAAAAVAAAAAAAAACGLQVSLDVQVGDRLGRLVLGLYGHVVPKTVRGQNNLHTAAQSICLPVLLEARASLSVCTGVGLVAPLSLLTKPLVSCCTCCCDT